MNIAEFKDIPSIREHWGQVGPHLESLLLDHMVETADGSAGGDKAQAEVGALKELARVIKILRQVDRKTVATPRAPITKPLHRNEKTEKSEKPTDTSKPK